MHDVPDQWPTQSGLYLWCQHQWCSLPEEIGPAFKTLDDALLAQHEFYLALCDNWRSELVSGKDRYDTLVQLGQANHIRLFNVARVHGSGANRCYDYFVKLSPRTKVFAICPMSELSPGQIPSSIARPAPLRSTK